MIKNKKVLILGMARSGLAVARLLSKYNNDITISDIKEQKEDIYKELDELNIKYIITDNQEEIVNETFDYVIKNPAIISTNPAIVKAKKLNLEVINELETSYKFLKDNVKIIGITGSNGKTTTTTMVYEMLKRCKENVYLGGNVGVPLASIVEDIKENSILVLEISDHQLCDMYKFKTDVSAMLNLSQVHLDFHNNSYDNYKSIKKKIFNNHTKDSFAILNKDDEEVIALSKDIPSKKLYFSKEKGDIYLENDNIIYNNEKIINTKNINIKGIHNYENIMAAILIVKLFNVDDETIVSYLKTFKGVEHRIEFVRELNKRKFYNDSKSTNNKSTIIAISSFNDDIILLMGGLDRNIPFDEISPYLKNVKTIICFGQTKNKIKEFADKNNINVIVKDDLLEATKKAYEISKEGDIILLSPACASWDQFPDFETRGKAFKDLVNSFLD